MLKRFSFVCLSFFAITALSFANGVRVAVIPWGSGESQLGLRTGKEIDHVGPLSFAVDSANTIYFLDEVNGRISVFDLAGKHLKNVGKNIRGSSIAVTDDGNVAVLQNKEIHLLDPQGNLQKIVISPDIALTRGYGQHLRVHQGEVYATQLNQHLKKVVQHNSGKFQAADNSGSNLEFAGLPGKASNQTYTVDWKNKHLVLVKGSAGYLVTLTTHDAFGGLQVIGVDNSENVYVESERVTQDGYAHLDIYKLSSAGQVLGVQEIPNMYATTVFKKTELLNDGTVLQMVTTPSGVEIWKWTF